MGRAGLWQLVYPPVGLFIPTRFRMVALDLFDSIRFWMPMPPMLFLGWLDRRLIRLLRLSGNDNLLRIRYAHSAAAMACIRCGLKRPRIGATGRRSCGSSRRGGG